MSWLGFLVTTVFFALKNFSRNLGYVPSLQGGVLPKNTCRRGRVESVGVSHPRGRKCCGSRASFSEASLWLCGREVALRGGFESRGWLIRSWREEEEAWAAGGGTRGANLSFTIEQTESPASFGPVEGRSAVRGPSRV